MAKTKSTTRSHVALLRGLNVGGRNALKMEQLRAVCGELGCRNVSTYIQSGNVVFDIDAADLKELPAKLQSELALRYDISTPVIIRTAAQFKSVLKQNPYLDLGAEDKQIHVLFLKGRPTSAACAQLQPAHAPEESFAIHGKEIYFYLPHGAARTKLTSTWFERALNTISTGRNWRTTLKIAALLGCDV